jgi:5'(3')-deoxyribonucleotidase
MKVYHILEAKEVASSSKIYVDMDGVLADFFTEWGKLMGKENWRDIGIDQIPAALEKIKQTENFWLDLPLTKNAENLLSIIKNVKGSYNICSSPLPGDPNSEPHKREWIKKNLSFFPPEEIIITHNKTKWATQADGTPNILIDDYGKNIQAWEAAGGIGFKHKDHKFERTASAIKQHMQDPVTENFADGKKKGKSRPGRVKRSGASCKGSVTSLRKKAKKYSGERGRMYHWCANMKSGRKKK